MLDLKKLIEENTTDDVVDYEKVMASIDEDYVNPIVAKKTDKTKLLTEAVNSVAKDLGIDNVENLDGLKLYVKQMGGNTDEIKEENIKLANELKELASKYDTEVETRTKLENESKLDKQYSAIKSLGVTDQDELEFLHYKLNKAVTEEKDFTAVVDDYRKEHGISTTAKFVKDDFGGAKGDINIGEVWKQKNKRK